jgi:4-hydroxybenzoate polyprenyltransferase
MSNLITNFFKANEKTPITLFNIFFSIISIVFVRTFLENFSSPYSSGYIFPPEILFIHFIYFYFSIIFSVILLLYFFTKTNFPELFSLSIKISPIVLFPPLFDLAMGEGWHIAYLFAGPKELFIDFLTFFGPITKIGTTPGMRIEVVFIIIASYLFIFYKTSSKFKSVIGAFSVYVLFFVYLTFPSFFMPFYEGVFSNSFLFVTNLYSGSLLELQQTFTGIANTQDYISTLEQAFTIFMSRIFWILIFLQLFAILFFYKKNITLAWLKNARWERIGYYCAIGFIGMLISLLTNNSSFPRSFTDILGIIIFFMLIAINFWLAVIINDFADIKIDTVSNTQRPLITKTIPEKEFLLIGIFLAIFLISGAVLLNYFALFLLLLFQFIYFIYSSHPLYLKKFFITSSFALGLNALIIAMAGFFLISPDQHLSLFPTKFIWLFFIGFSLLSNIKDIKDYAGDKLENIYTLPVLLGQKNSKLLISLSCALFVIIFPLFLNNTFLFLISFIPASLLIYLLNKKEYQETKVFLLFFFYLALLLFSFSR